MKTCPNCQKRTLSLITDLATNKRYCHRCIPNPMNCPGAVFVARKMEELHLAGKLNLETYPSEQRTDDLKDPPRGIAGSEPCRRPSGNFRAHFHTRESAEAFAADPANWPVYENDIAHLCQKCRYWHLSRVEWLFPDYRPEVLQ
jgi:hypothetical protein